MKWEKKAAKNRDSIKRIERNETKRTKTKPSQYFYQGIGESFKTIRYTIGNLNNLFDGHK